MPSSLATSGSMSPIRRIGRRGLMDDSPQPLELARSYVPDCRGGDQLRIEIVGRCCRHERLGQLTDPTHEVRAPAGIELRKDIVEQQERRLTECCSEQIQLSELERQDGRALLTARRKT